MKLVTTPSHIFHLSRIAGILALLLSVTALTGCRKSGFEVDFRLDKSVAANYRITYLNPDPKHSAAMEIVVPVTEGAFHAKYPLTAPAIVCVSILGQGNPIPVLVRPGDKIVFTGSTDNPMRWSVKGGKVNEQLTAWRLQNAAELEHGSPEKVNSLVADYVRKHPGEQTALIIFCTYFDRYADDALFRKLWTSLDEKLRDPHELAVVGRADLAETVTGKLPPLPKSFKARYLDDSLVTVKLKDARTTLFWVRTSTATEHSASVDSLRRIFRRGDAKRLRLVTLSFDADSSSMMRAYRFDSIPGEVPLWAPDAETGSLATQLGVTRTPYFLIADSLGKVLYRGDNITQALRHLPR